MSGPERMGIKMKISSLLNATFVSLIVIALVFICGCSSSSATHSSSSISQPITTSPTTVVPQPETVVTKDFETMALTINDLPHGWIKSGAPTTTDTTYEMEFVNPGGSNGVLLTFSIDRYATIDKAKKDFDLRKSKVTEVKVDALSIGDEGFGYQEPACTSAVFRNRNLIVSVSTNTYPAYSISVLQPYAKLVNSRINA